MEEIETNEIKKENRYKGMTSLEIARDVNEKGFRMDDLSDMLEALEADEERQNEEDRQAAYKDWMKFKCPPTEVELSIPISQINNFDGEFYSKAKCLREARDMLRALYDEAETMINKESLFAHAVKEIVSFADGRFKQCKISTRKEHPKEIAEEMDIYLDMVAFREEIEQRLERISPVRLRSYEHYCRLVEYTNVDEYNGDGIGKVIWGVIDAFAKCWNYSGYEAYRELDKDARNIAWKYAEQATKIARDALRKRVEWKDELLKSA